MPTTRKQTAPDLSAYATTATVGGKASQASMDAAAAAIIELQTLAGRLDVAVQEATPTNGSTVASDGSKVLALKHTSLIATLTITFPATPRAGQEFVITSRSAVTAVTLSASPTIYGTLVTLAALGFARFVYAPTAAAWFRTG
jgi:hypothetical protein